MQRELPLRQDRQRRKKISVQKKRKGKVDKERWSKPFITSLILHVIVLYLLSGLLSTTIAQQPVKEPKLIMVDILELPEKNMPKSKANTKKVENISPKIKERVKPNLKKEEKKPKPIKPKIEPQKKKINLPQASKGDLKSRAPDKIIKAPDVAISSDFLKKGTDNTKRPQTGEKLPLPDTSVIKEGGDKGNIEIDSTYSKIKSHGEVNVPIQGERYSPYGDRPVAVVIENSPGAIPQSGLSRADLVYEVPVEGGMTRFLAVFSGKDVGKVGPIRSARVYLAEKAKELGAVYVHAGGSPQGVEYVKEKRIDNIDEFKNFEPFFRIKEKKPPHNLYASTVLLRKEMAKLGYDINKMKDEYLFRGPGEEVQGRKIDTLTIKYSKNYVVTYRYDKTKGGYIRYINGKIHIDKLKRNPIVVTNLIIQRVSAKVRDEKGRLYIKFVGKGNAEIFMDGKLVEATWVKKSEDDRTKFLDIQGDEIRFVPGNIWIEVVPNWVKVIY